MDFIINKITAIIPARGGSKNIPRKNIYMVNGHPLIAYSITACKLCKNIDRIIVSTEDDEIASMSKEYGAEVPFKRPEEYASDDSSDLGFLKHFFQNINVDEVALVRPTTPLRDPCFMADVIDVYFENKHRITGLRTAEEMNQPAYKMFKIVDGFFEGLFPHFNGIRDYTNLPRQTFPKTFLPNGHIDIVKRGIVESNSVFGDRIFACISKRLTDIDKTEDFELLKNEINGKYDFISKYIRGDGNEENVYYC